MYGSKAAVALELYTSGGGGGGGSTAAGGGSGDGGCFEDGRLLPLQVVATLASRPSLGRHLVVHTGAWPRSCVSISSCGGVIGG